MMFWTAKLTSNKPISKEDIEWGVISFGAGLYQCPWGWVSQVSINLPEGNSVQLNSDVNELTGKDLYSFAEKLRVALVDRGHVISIAYDMTLHRETCMPFSEALNRVRQNYLTACQTLPSMSELGLEEFQIKNAAKYTEATKVVLEKLEYLVKEYDRQGLPEYEPVPLFERPNDHCVRVYHIKKAEEIEL